MRLVQGNQREYSSMTLATAVVAKQAGEGGQDGNLCVIEFFSTGMVPRSATAACDGHQRKPRSLWGASQLSACGKLTKAEMQRSGYGHLIQLSG